MKSSLINSNKKLGDSDYEKIVKAFKKFYANPNTLLSDLWYIDFDSLSKNFKKVFGVNEEFFCKVFYYYLSGGSDMEHISLYHFTKAMAPFFTGDRATML
jgi:hypothetical protein